MSWLGSEPCEVYTLYRYRTSLLTPLLPLIGFRRVCRQINRSKNVHSISPFSNGVNFLTLSLVIISPKLLTGSFLWLGVPDPSRVVGVYEVK